MRESNPMLEDATELASLLTRIAYDMIAVEAGDIDFETFVDITRAAMTEKEAIILRYTGGTDGITTPRVTGEDTWTL